MAIVGRDPELEFIRRALAGAATQSRVLLVEAPAGTGKSTVLRAAIEAATGEVTTIVSQPTLAERHLPYAAIGDLLATIHDFSALDAPSRRTLERVLLRSDDVLHDNTAIDARVVGTACSAVWAALATERPLMIVVDDIQWLDVASGTALAFSVRRLPPRNVFVLCARRAGEPSVDFAGERLDLDVLNDEAITALVAGTTSINTPLLRRVTATAAGNPLYALELAREVERRSRNVDDGLAIPTALAALIDERLASIYRRDVDHESGDDASHDGRGALLRAALAARPEVTLMRRLGALDAIATAERERLVSTSTGRVVFAHPLFAAAILDAATPIETRAAHRQLAEAVESDEERVRHLGLAAESDDLELAVQLHRTAHSVASRGAFDHAAELALLALRRTPTSAAERADHAISAAQLSFQRGDAERAIELLVQLDFDAIDQASNVRGHILWATLEFGVGSSIVARQLGLKGLQAARTDQERAEAHTILARVSYEHFPTALEHAEQALALVEGLVAAGTVVEPIVMANAISAVVGNRFIAGFGLDRELFGRAIELEKGATISASDTAFASMAALLKVADELDDAREMLTSLLSSTEDEGSIPYALSHLPQLELWTGNWDGAEDVASRHLEAAIRTGQHDQARQANNNIALINAYRGDTATAAILARELMDAGRENGDMWTERSGAGLLGFIALSDGDATEAVRLIGWSEELADRMGLREPGYRRLRADLVEALVATGQLDAAAEHADAMWETASRLNRTTSMAIARRVQALIAAARGDRDLGVALANEAVERIAATPLVFEHARALLTHGQIHRRFKEKSAARTSLQAALDIFDLLGAQRFAERARRDLARIGLRPAASAGLTETELRVAELAVTGRTVRQVGDELYISAKTVEANLTRVYRKLGIKGRVELATWMAGRSSV